MSITLASSLRKRFRDDVSRELARLPQSIGTLTEAALAPLPPPVQRYVRSAGFVGRPHTLNARITWERMRLRRAPKSGWLELAAEQINAAPAPMRLALMTGRLGGCIPLAGCDAYQAQHGSLRIQLLGFLCLEDARGPQIDASELVTVLSESLLLPSSALQPYLRWEPRDDRSAWAEMRDGPLRVGGTFHFNDADEYVRFDTDDRHQSGNPPRRCRWSADLGAYQTHDGLRFPTRLSATWHEPDGAFTYVEGTIARIAFNVRA